MRLKHVEDVAETLVPWLGDASLQRALGDPWFEKFLNSIYTRTLFSRQPLTTEQAKIVLKVLARARSWFVDRGWSDATIQAMLDAPVYRLPPTQSVNIPRQVRHVGGNLLAVRFKRHDNILADLQSLDARFTPPVWDTRHRVWLVPITSSNHEGLLELIGGYRFEVDDAVVESLAATKDKIGERSGFVYDDTTNEILVNVGDNDLLARWVSATLAWEPSSGVGGLDQDFTFTATPSIARRIVRMSMANSDMVIDPKLVDLARQGVVHPSTFVTYSELRGDDCSLVQELLDLDLRATVAMPDNRHWAADKQWLRPILVAARLRGIEHIVYGKTVFSEREYRSLAGQYGYDAQHVHFANTDHDVARLRANSLLVDIYESRYEAFTPPLSLEFPCAVVVTPRRSAYQARLFPDLPVLGSLIGEHSSELWKRKLNCGVKKIAFMFHVAMSLAKDNH